MQPYQEEYIANLKEISMLTIQKKQRYPTFEDYKATLERNQQQIEQKITQNMELLRQKLFPVLDHIFDASKNDLQELQEFAENLLNGKEGLDIGLSYQIHKALLNFARLTKDRCAIIRELYWQGIGYNKYCNKLISLNQLEIRTYNSRMRLCFTEAAAYLKYFDEIEDTETRGYILRSRANMSLGKFKTASEKIHLVKQTLQILQDHEYQKKEPNLPWDRFIYLTHQQMSASISHSRENTMTSEDVADVMESVYIIYQRRNQEAASKNEKPPVRSQFSYYAIEYYCGLDHLDGLLTKMEKLMDTASLEDFSTDSMYAIISLPAFYFHYLTQYPERIPERKEYIENLYQKILNYMEAFPGSAENESLFYYLQQLSITFLEIEHSISYKEFLQKLQIHFAPEIFIHSWAVGTAAVTLCSIILEEEPTFFDDIEMIQEIKNHKEKREAILHYAMEAGLLHDIGKINFISLYSQTARQWFEDEDEMMHLHTLIGKTCLETRPSTVCYADISFGHHSWYDGSRGYPNSYKRLNCQYRQMVDVIGLIDWLDDVVYMTRPYTGVEKNYHEAVESAVSLEGRQFSPLLTVRLQDKKIAAQIQQALTDGREEAYRRLYKEHSTSENTSTSLN